MSQNIKVIFHEPDFQAAVDLIVQDDAQNTERLLRQLVVVRAKSGEGFAHWMRGVYTGPVLQHILHIMRDDPDKFHALAAFSRAEIEEMTNHVLASSNREHVPQKPSPPVEASILPVLRFPSHSNQMDRIRDSLEGVNSSVLDVIFTPDPNAPADDRAFEQKNDKFIDQIKALLEKSPAELMGFLTTPDECGNTPLDHLIDRSSHVLWKKVITALDVKDIACLLKTRNEYGTPAIDRLRDNTEFFPRFVAMLWNYEIAELNQNHGIVLEPALPSESMLRMQELIKVARDRA